MFSCHAASDDTEEVTVCGCNIKVRASFTQECIHSSPVEVGSCDCGAPGTGSTACVTHTIPVGYGTPTNVNVQSFKVVAC